MNFDDISLMKKPLIYSAIFHVFLIISGFLSTLIHKQQAMLLIDVEFAGEGELREILERQPIIIKQEEDIKSKNEPPKEEHIIEETKEKLETEATLSNSEKLTKEIKEQIPRDENELQLNQTNRPEKKTEEKIEIKKKKKSLRSIVKNAEKAQRKKKLIESVQKATKKKKEEDFRKMMSKSISDLPKSSNKTPGKGKNGRGAGSFGDGDGLSENDYALISSQIYPHWVVPSGVKDAENIIIEIRVKLRDNGEVFNTKIIDKRRYDSDYIFRAAADSARRAVLEASPLNIPKRKIDLFREFIFRFNLKEALGE